jgi:hypothetical protein
VRRTARQFVPAGGNVVSLSFAKETKASLFVRISVRAFAGFNVERLERGAELVRDARGLGPVVGRGLTTV